MLIYIFYNSINLSLSSKKSPEAGQSNELRSNYITGTICYVIDAFYDLQKTAYPFISHR